MMKHWLNISATNKTKWVLPVLVSVLFIFTPYVNRARTIVIKPKKYSFVLSSSLRQFYSVIDGFKSSEYNAKVQILNLRGQADRQRVRSFIKSTSPDMIIALGALAATTTAAVEQKTPIAFAMVLNYKRYALLRQPNVTGISMEIPPTIMLTQFRMLYPGLQSIAVPYNPHATEELINDIRVAAAQLNISLQAIPVQNPDNIINRLTMNKKKINALWMIADFHLYNNKSRAYHKLITYAQEKKLPLLAVSQAFVKIGALFSVSVNYRSLGSQLSLMGRKIVYDNQLPAKIFIKPPVGTFTAINKKMAEKIKGANPELYYQIVDKIYPVEP